MERIYPEKLYFFFKRNPNVLRRKAQWLNTDRAKKLNKFIAADQFGKLKEIFSKYDFFKFAERVFNMDEKGCRLHLHKDPRVLALKGASQVRSVGKEHGEIITVVVSGNSVCSIIPLIISYSGWKKNKAWWKVCLLDHRLKSLENGAWKLNFFYLLHHFARFQPNGPCLLIYDRAKAHFFDCKIFEEFINALQPLDKSCFRMLWKFLGPRGSEIFWLKPGREC